MKIYFVHKLNLTRTEMFKRADISRPIRDYNDPTEKYIDKMISKYQTLRTFEIIAGLKKIRLIGVYKIKKKNETVLCLQKNDVL